MPINKTSADKKVGGKNKILIVEDEIALLKALADKFVKSGFDVVTAKNGQEGLDLYFKEKPQLIILDIVMPVMDGMTMLTKVREKNGGKIVPVIILTNLSDTRKVQEAMKHKVFDYLVKTDWSLDDIIAKAKKSLAK